MIRAVAFNPCRHVEPRPGVSLIDEQTLRATGADEHLVAVDDAGRVAARCSLWRRGGVAPTGEPIGFIGHYAAAPDEATDPDAAAVLLKQALRWLSRAGAAIAVGPIDGSTWRSYRLITHRGDRPAFFLEPDHPASWPGHFTRAGFAPLATYFSAEVHDLTVRLPKFTKLQHRLTQRGVTIRPIELDRFEQELTRIHALSLSAFARNFLYSPIDRDGFVALYRRLRDHLAPELILLAERDDALLGFVFAVPDLLEAQRAEKIESVVIKSLAIAPGRETAGLGGLLMQRCQLAAHAMGYRRGIHALMHESNKSLSLSSHYGRPFRRYTLFSRRVQP